MSLTYQGKRILAPMVRVGTLPMRLLALKYGADIVYSEEIIDFKILKTTRFDNKILGTVDFVLPDGTVVFRTCETEKQKVVFQMGTADPGRALKAARMLENDVAGIDVNMGCPKDYSVKGGMGAALLTQPDNAYKILVALVQGINKPVTCKIRILPTVEETITFAKRMESTGIVALGVHGREKHERSREPVHIDVIRKVAEAVSFPVIANGVSSLVKTFEDIEKYRLETGCSSVMLARAAQWNPSIFRKEGRLPASEVIAEYIKLAVDFDNTVGNTKYCLQRLLHEDTTSKEAKDLQHTTNMREICEIWNLVSYYEDAIQRRKTLEESTEDKIDRSEKRLKMDKHYSMIRFITALVIENQNETKKRKLPENTSDITEMKVKYHSATFAHQRGGFVPREWLPAKSLLPSVASRRNYPHSVTPKALLLEWTRRNNLKQPTYEITERTEDRWYKSIVVVDNKKYSSTEWVCSKKSAHQAAAIVCLQSLGVPDGRAGADVT